MLNEKKISLGELVGGSEEMIVFGQKTRFFHILEDKSSQCNWNNSRTNIAMDLRFSTLERGNRRLSLHIK